MKIRISVPSGSRKLEAVSHKLNKGRCLSLAEGLLLTAYSLILALTIKALSFVARELRP